MPLQRSYDVTSTEGGDDNRKTASLFTRSCMLWLIGFFISCILILIVCLVWLGPPKDRPETEKSTHNDQVESLNGSVKSHLNRSNEQYTADKNQPASTNVPITTPPTVIKKYTEPSTTLHTTHPSGQTSTIQNHTESATSSSATQPSLAENTTNVSVSRSNNQSSTSIHTIETSSSRPENQSETSQPTDEKQNPGGTTESSTSLSASQPSLTGNTTNVSVSQSNNQSSTSIHTIETSSSRPENQSETSQPTDEKQNPGGTTESSTSLSASQPSLTGNTTNVSVSQSNNQSSTSIHTIETSSSRPENQSETSQPTDEKQNPGGTTESSTSLSASQPSLTGNTTNVSVSQSNNQSSTSIHTIETSSSRPENQSETSQPTDEKQNPGGTTESSTSLSASQPSLTGNTTNVSVSQSNNQSSTSIHTIETSSSRPENQSETSQPTDEKQNPGGTTESSTSLSASQPSLTGNTTNVSVSQSNNQSSTSIHTIETSSSRPENQSETSQPTDEKQNPGGTTESSTSLSASQPSLTGNTTNVSVSQSNNQSSTSIHTIETSSSRPENQSETSQPTDEKQKPDVTTKSSTSVPTTESSISNTVTSAAGSQVASQMLFYMNHAADACEDFYEYACGGFEANQLMSENDLAKRATERIFDQAKKISSSGQDTGFQGYYQSCVNYHKNSTRSDKIEYAKKAIDEVGKFYKHDEWNDDFFNLNTMLSKLLLRNSAPLFDVTVDVAVDDRTDCSDQVEGTKFTWKLGPPVLESNSYRDQMERDCYVKLASAMLEKDVDLSKLYKNHTLCKNNLKDFLDSVQEALENLSSLNTENIGEARFGIELDLMPAFYKTYPDPEQKSKDNPTEGEIHEAYVTKEYTAMKIDNLQQKLPTDEPFLNLTLLLETLKGSAVELKQPLQVYFPQVILKGLNDLYNVLDRRHLNNGLLGLYAHKVYYEFVVSPPDVEDHCKRVATSLMGTHASSLYMSSFSTKELTDMKDTVTGVFEKLKSTLESDLRNASWLGKTNETEFVRKIRNLTLEIPDMSYYQNDHKLSTEDSEINITLTGNFFDDTMMLQKNYRKSMYNILDKSPSDYEQIWRHFGLPHQTAGSAIYGLNKIVLPYGAIDWSAVWSAKNMSSDHLVFATLGTRIAELIAHHFDSTGVQYFAGRRSKEPPAVFCSNETSAAQTYSDYIDGYRSPFNDLKRLVLSSTGQNVNYVMTDLSLNERFSATTGLQLAYDTILDLPSESKKLLPWLTNGKTDEKKQFFLAYAQMHCTKVPLTSSFASLYEDEHLPSRLRILAASSSNEIWGSTWRKCEIGSNIRPEHIPSPFPHLEVEEGDDVQQVED